MDSLNPESPAALAPAAPILPQQRVWKFWGTALWGFFIFGGMFVGQVAVVAWFVLQQEGRLTWMPWPPQSVSSSAVA